MAKYEYDSNIEVFKRTDNRGNHLCVNISEAQRIISMVDMGYTVESIKSKVILSNPRGSFSTVNSFIKNYKEGNIIMPDNAPAPSIVFGSVTDDIELVALENRVEKLEQIVEELSSKKSFRERLGL